MEVFVSRREKQNIIQVQAEMCLGCIDWRKLSPNIHHISNISLSLSVSSLFFFLSIDNDALLCFGPTDSNKIH